MAPAKILTTEFTEVTEKSGVITNGVHEKNLSIGRNYTNGANLMRLLEI
jgi:hypothetical protein